MSKSLSDICGRSARNILWLCRLISSSQPVDLIFRSHGYKGILCPRGTEPAGGIDVPAEHLSRSIYYIFKIIQREFASSHINQCIADHSPHHVPQKPVSAYGEHYAGERHIGCSSRPTGSFAQVTDIGPASECSFANDVKSSVSPEQSCRPGSSLLCREREGECRDTGERKGICRN